MGLLDMQQRGVGGDNSWGRLPHDPFRLLPKTYAYTFRLKAFEGDAAAAMAASRTRVPDEKQ